MACGFESHRGYYLGRVTELADVRDSRPRKDERKISCPKGRAGSTPASASRMRTLLTRQKRTLTDLNVGTVIKPFYFQKNCFVRFIANINLSKKP